MGVITYPCLDLSLTMLVKALTQVIIWSFLQYPHLSDQQNPKLHNHKALQAELNHLVSEMIGKTQKCQVLLTITFKICHYQLLIFVIHISHKQYPRRPFVSM